jgi:hypothetical protein
MLAVAKPENSLSWNLSKEQAQLEAGSNAERVGLY